MSAERHILMLIHYEFVFILSILKTLFFTSVLFQEQNPEMSAKKKETFSRDPSAENLVSYILYRCMVIMNLYP